MARARRYPEELLERATRLVFESGRPVAHVAADLGLPSETRCGRPDDRCRRVPSACLQADHASATQQLADDPGLIPRLTDEERAAIIRAAEHGNTVAVALMLDLGFPIETHGDDRGGTALHVAAYSGSADTVRLLLDRGADIEAHDTNWNSTPLEWAVVGSGEKPKNDPIADWVETVRILLETDASLDTITLAPDDPKPPSAEVAALLRTHRDRRSP